MLGNIIKFHRPQDNFDPILYFPAIFRNFTQLMAVHADAMSQCEEIRDTPEWIALQMLYRVDMDAFSGT